MKVVSFTDWATGYQIPIETRLSEINLFSLVPMLIKGNTLDIC